MSFMMVWEVDEEILRSHQLHDGVSQELHPLVVTSAKGGGRWGGESSSQNVSPLFQTAGGAVLTRYEPGAARAGATQTLLL